MTQAPSSGDTSRGLAFAISAYLLWGFLPLYMKALSDVPPLEIVGHRILWSVPVATAILIWLGRTKDIRAALTSPRMLAMGALTAALISVNWLIYVWSITSGHALDAALGYYINPLFSVFLGAVVLKERLRGLQWVAIALATLAVVVLTVEAGRLPLVSLGLTLSWGLYALAKRALPIGPNQGFLLEVVILLPVAVVYVGWLTATGEGHFTASLPTTLLLIGTGLVTAIPLMLYANGAKGLTLTTIAVLQYIAPTLIFLTAVFLFGEEFDGARRIAFPMIWAALVIYTLSLFRRK